MTKLTPNFWKTATDDFNFEN